MYHLPALVSLTRTARRRGLRDTAADLVSLVARPELAHSLPRHLQIEVITRCNLACVMCPRTVALDRAHSEGERAVWQRELPLEKFTSIIEQFPSLQTLSLHGIGEPLMHRHLLEMVATAAGRGVQVRFTTNATLLSRSKSEGLIRAGLHRIIISLDGTTGQTYESIRVGAKFAEVAGNVRELSACRRELKAAHPFIEIAMVVSTLNSHEVADMVELAAGVGADGLILSPVQPPVRGMVDLVCDSDAWNDAAREAANRARNAGVKLHLRGGPRSAGRSRPPGEKKTYQCLHPWLSAVVTIDGRVMPCCNIHESEYSMGDAFAQRFSDIWNDSTYQNFRAELKVKGRVPLPCKWCPDF